MKSYSAGLAAAIIAVALAGCNGSETKEKLFKPTLPTAAQRVKPAPVAANGKLMLNQYGMPTLTNEGNLGCVTCHRINTRLVGPAWMKVSEKYKDAKTYKYSAAGSDDPSAKTYPLVDGLVMKVSRGGHGNWGTMSMPANDPTGAKKEQIKTVVKFILGLANK